MLQKKHLLVCIVIDIRTRPTQHLSLAQEHLSAMRKVRKRLYTQKPLQEYGSMIATNADTTEKGVVI